MQLQNQRQHTGGAFGQVTSGIVTQDSYKDILSLQKKVSDTLKTCRLGEMPKPLDHIIIKRVPFTSYLSNSNSNSNNSGSNSNGPRNTATVWKEFIKDCEIECRMHYLMASHPIARKYVPRFFFAGLDRETFVIVMQYVPGATLDDLLSRKQRNGRYVRLTRDQFNRIKKALRELHQAGFRHGDLHTGNVILDTASDQVFFIDFTTAHVHGETYNGSMFLKNNKQSLSVLEAYVRD